MTFFSFLLPRDLQVYLKVLGIHSEEELIDFFEQKIPLFTPIEFGWILFKNTKMKKLFFLYQQHINNGETPLLMHFTANVQKKFLTMGILDEKQLKEFALTSSIVLLTNKQSVYYDFVREIIRSEVNALDNFQDHFSSRARNALGYFQITNFYDLRTFIIETNLNIGGIGAKTKKEILEVWEREFLRL